jgi:hypothetical protein
MYNISLIGIVTKNPPLYSEYILIKNFLCQAPVAHTYNPSYSGGRDRSQPGKIVLRDPISKKTFHKKRAGGVAQGVGPDFKPQYCKKIFF